jgi:hypothetical protein
MEIPQQSPRLREGYRTKGNDNKKPDSQGVGLFLLEENQL